VALWGLGVTAGVTATALLRPAFLHLVDYKICDTYLAAGVGPSHPAEPLIVDIDEPSLERYGRWPWPRARVAALLNGLTRLEPAAVGLDLLFPEPERTAPPGGLEPAPPGQGTAPPSGNPHPLSAGDRALAAALRSGPFVIGQQFEFGDRPGSSRPCVLHPLATVWALRGGASPTGQPPPLHTAGGVVCSIPSLAGAAAMSGFLNAAPDQDGVLRAVPLVVRYRDQVYPSLPLATVLRAAGADQVVLEADAGGVTAVDTGRGPAPVGPRGDLLLRYRGGRGTFPRVSARDVLEARVAPELVRGRTVLVGATAFGLDETVATPLDGVLPGVEVLATVVDNLLAGDYLQRPAYGRGAELLAAAAAGLLATLLLTLGRPAWGVPLLVGLGVAIWHGSAWGFQRHGVFLSPLFPLVALGLAGAAMVFARYLDESRRAASSARHLVATRNLMMESLASLSEIRDRRTGGHGALTQRHVRSLCEALARTTAFRDHLDGERIDALTRLAPLHDIGKAGIPDGVLMKSGTLSPAEFSMIKKHTCYGEEVIARAGDRAGVENHDLLEMAREIVASHHERWDGGGYPAGTRGAAIPLAGRIVAIVDVYEALTSARPYRSAHSHEDAVEIIREGSGTQFDPELVEVFLTVEAEWRQWEGDAAEAWTPSSP
jgi:adenylate cyclase